VGLPWSYFEKRGCFIDARGPLVLDATSRWGFGVTVLTESHGIAAWPAMSKAIPYGVTVEERAWIGSFSVLAGCVIGARSIVAAGSVVRGQTVGPGVMVAGNPARVIARWDGARWVYVPTGISGYKRTLT
jgi:maltose O-acetyltransferase